MSTKLSLSACTAPAPVRLGDARSLNAETGACRNPRSPTSGRQSTEQMAKTEQMEKVESPEAHRAGERSFMAYLRMLLEGTIGR